MLLISHRRYTSWLSSFAFVCLLGVGCGSSSVEKSIPPTDAQDEVSDAQDTVAVDLAEDSSPELDGDDAETTQDTNPADVAPVACGCFAGEGAFCALAAQALAEAEGCVLEGVDLAEENLLSCMGEVWSTTETCAAGCELAESIGADECGLPFCDCFVQVSWCGASAARHGLGLDPPCRVPLVPEHDQDILACDGPTWIVKEACAEGCYEAPTGTPDACLDNRTSETPGWEPCPHLSQLAWGLHPEASDRLRCAGVTASRITQTIGDAAASAGYHAADGTADGLSYCAAVDLRARDLTEAEIRDLLDRLGSNGFAAWYRKPGYDGWPSSGAPHIHAVFAGVPMKSQLRAQVRDFLIGLNALSSHTPYQFWHPSALILDTVRLLFSRNYTP